MREQQGSGDVAAGRRGGVIRSLLGVERRLGEGDADAAEGAVGVSSGKQPAAADSRGEERKAVVRVVAADMPPALQRRAFRCARDELAAMPHFPRRLEPKRLALALKKVLVNVFFLRLIMRKRPVATLPMLGLAYSYWQGHLLVAN